MRCPTCHAPLATDTAALCPACLLEEGLGLIEESAAFGESLLEDSAPKKNALDSVFSTKVLGAVREKTGAIADFLSSDRGDGYDVGGLLARGGMGSIHKALDRNCGRTVAMKLLHASKERNAVAVQRFITEAQITAQLEHPNIVPVHDLGILASGDRVYYTMKYVQGRDLGSIIDAIKQGDPDMIEHFPLSRMLEIYLKVCDAIAFAHARDVVHRDLKPDNIMVAGFGEVLVLDWGLAKVLGESDHPEHAEELRDSLKPSGGRAAKYVAGTAVGQILGTVAYMSPEQAKGANEEIDARSDIYALGGILYSILTLVPPIRPGSMDEMIDAVLENQIMDPQQRAREAVYNPFATRGRLPSSLCAVAMKAMAHGPNFRYQNVLELQHDIHAYLSGFATEAEEATPLQELRLYLTRKWALVSVLAVAVILILSMGVASILSMRTQHEALVESRDQATKAANDAILALGKWKESEKRQQSLRTLSAMETLRQADSLITEGDLAAAAVFAIDATDEAPELVDAWYTRARLDIANGDLAEASRHLAHAMQLEPGSHLPILGYHAGVLNAHLSPSPAALAELAIRLTANDDSVILHHFLQHLNDQKRARGLLQLMTDSGHFRPQAATDSIQRDGLHVVLREGPPAALRELSLARIAIESPELSYDDLRDIDCLELDLRRAPPGDLGKLANLGLRVLHLPAMTVDARQIDSLGLQELHLYGGDLVLGNTITGGRVQLHLHGPAIGLAAQLQGADLAGLHLYGLPAEKLDFILARLSPSLPILGFYDTPLRQLDFLVGRQLKRLILRNTRVSDLKPLRGQDLELLDLEGSPVADIDPLIGMRLHTLRLSRTRVTELRAIRGMPLRELTVARLKNLDRAPLAGHNLQMLDASHSDLTTLTPLLDMPLQELRLHGCSLIDLAPLNQMTSLRSLSIDERPKPAVLQLPNLVRFSRGEHLQPVEVARLHQALRRVNPAYPDSGVFTLRHGVVIGASLRNAQLEDISPLRDLPLYSLDLSANPALKNLSPLDSTPLVSLDISGTAVTQLPFIRSAPLRSLRLVACSALNTLDLRNSQLQELVIDHSPLRTIRLPQSLRKLSAIGVPAAAHPFILRDLQLSDLTLSNTQFESLSALTAMPLKVLRIADNPITDPEQLTGFTDLRVLDISAIPARPEHVPLDSLQELWAEHELIQEWTRARPNDPRVRRLQRLHRDRPRGRFERFGHTFERLPGEMTLVEALSACEKLGGSLLTIANVAEFAFFHQYVLGGNPVWVDLSSTGGNVWQDSRGAVSKYLEWEPGAPSNEPGRNQIVLGLNGKARMVNRSPEEKFGVICQWRK